MKYLKYLQSQWHRTHYSNHNFTIGGAFFEHLSHHRRSAHLINSNGPSDNTSSISECRGNPHISITLPCFWIGRYCLKWHSLMRFLHTVLDCLFQLMKYYLQPPIMNDDFIEIGPLTGLCFKSRNEKYCFRPMISTLFNSATFRSALLGTLCLTCQQQRQLWQLKKPK